MPEEDEARKLTEEERLAPPTCGPEGPTRENRPAAGLPAHEMETLGSDSSNDISAADTWSGETFGDYELLQMIAKGGMGVVYKARQKTLNRIVALKMILAGQFADQQDVERFYVEAKAAASLRHPNIVSVHEVGEAEGQHYFSMDYVEGQSLGSLVREQPLSAQRAAELVKTIAEAIQFAHDRGILHRDMKPSNVLLDEAGRPLLTDFGLAKRVGGQSQITLTGAVIGTPSYMPPEQAAARGDEVGRESDVYRPAPCCSNCLPAPPFRAASAVETLQQVLLMEPPSPRLLNPSVPADLETVCLKCLQKEPLRRYQTAQELADELERYIAGEPILARPVSRYERCARWCKRNPHKIACLSTALALSLALAAGVFIHSYVRTSAALKKAEQSLQQALRSVDRLFTTVSENRLLNEPGAQSLRKELLQNAQELYQEILAQQGNDPEVRDELAMSYFRLGQILADIDAPRDALAAYDAARRLQEQLAEDQPDKSAWQQELGDTWNAMGNALHQLQQLDESLQWHQRALEIRSQISHRHPQDVVSLRKEANSFMNLGLLQKDRGLLENARENLEKAQARRREILRPDADIVLTETDAEAVQRDLAMGYFNLAFLARVSRDASAARGDAASAQQMRQEAVRCFQLAAKAFQVLLAENPQDLKNRHRLAICYRLLGNEASLSQAELDEDVQAEALALYEQALRQIEPPATRNSAVHQYQAELAGVYSELGGLLVEGELRDTALAPGAYKRAVVILQPLVEKYPDIVRYRLDLAVTLRAIGLEELLADQIEQAREHLQASLACLEQLTVQFPDDAGYLHERDETLQLLSELDRPTVP